MSSSLLVQKMREEVKNRNLEDVKIGSCAKIQLNRYLDEADIVLIAPQLHFFAQEIKNISQPYHVQVIDIDMQDYGNLNAKAILDKVLEPPVSSVTSYNKESKLNQLMNKLYPYTKWIATNRPLNAISKAFISIMPATVIGSLFILIKNLPFNNYTAWLEKSGLSDILNLASGATIDILSIYLAFFISYHLVESYHHQGHGAGLISTVCFFLVTGRTNNGYDITYLGSNGMFSAIFVSITVGYLYIKIINRHMQIQLPKNVPAQVRRSFEAIIPSFIIISVFLVITALIAKTPYGQRVLQNLVRTISDKYFLLSRRVDLLLLKSLRAKVCAYLLSEAEVHHSLTFTIPYSRIQLADYLNCDRSALSRELSLMQRDGLLETYKSSFKLLEPDALRHMVL